MTHRSRFVGAWLAAVLFFAAVTAFAGDSGPAPGRKLVVASWNMAWLADLRAPVFWSACASGSERDLPRGRFPPCDAYQHQGIDDAAAYEAIKLKAVRTALSKMAVRGADVVALQEVQGPIALVRVLPAGYRIACFTSREDALNLAFIVRRDFAMEFGCREFTALSLEDDPSVARPVRRGLELTLRRPGHELALLNVHLKAACARGRMDDAANAACRVLQAQAAPLEHWIEQQALAGRAFLVVGDWNRDLEQEVRGGFPARNDGCDPRSPVIAASVRNLYAEINDGDPPQSAMALAKVDRSAASAAGCHEALDHLVVGEPLRRVLDPASLEDGRVTGRLVRVPPAASDHCMLEASLTLME
jgi:endonuclease/exonuclease/phosphatase family metal-dependent hydrolase